MDSQTSLKDRIFSISSSKITFLFPEEVNNPAVTMTLKMQNIDIIFSTNISSYFNQDLSNNLIAYVITDKNVYVPDLLKKYGYGKDKRYDKVKFKISKKHKKQLFRN